jgi:hypothetical protein
MAMKVNACMNTVKRRAAVVLVWKSRGGMTGVLFESPSQSSLAIPANIRTTPTVRRAVVSGDDQLVSPLLNPTSNSTIDVMIRKSPKKSNSAMCSLIDFFGCGFN